MVAFDAKRLMNEIGTKADTSLDRIIVGRQVYDDELCDTLETFYKDMPDTKYGRLSPVIIYASETFMQNVVDLYWDNKSTRKDMYDEIMDEAKANAEKIRTPQEVSLAGLKYASLGRGRFSVQCNITPEKYERQYLNLERRLVRKILDPQLDTESSLKPLCVAFGKLIMNKAQAREFERQNPYPDVEFPRIVELGPLEVTSLRS